MSRDYAAGHLAVLFAAACLSTLASATTQRTFVASHGVDNPNCSLTSPCRGFAAAITATTPGGEVIVLDSAGYGPVTITKSISIVAPRGVYGGISVLSGDGVTINGAGINVVLRGLTINGQGGTNGVMILNAAEVHVESCVVANLANQGIQHLAGKLYVNDTIVRNNAGEGVWSVGTNGGAPVLAFLDRVRLEGNSDGIRAQDAARVSVQDSVMSGNVNAGAFAFASGVDSTTLVVTRSLLSGNAQGAHARSIDGGTVAYLTLSDDTINDNDNGDVYASGLNLGPVYIRAQHNTVGGHGVFLSSPNSVILIDGNMISGDLAGFGSSSSTVATRDNNTIFALQPDTYTLQHITGY